MLVLIAAALLMFAGYSLGRVDGFRDGRKAGGIDAPRAPSAAQTVVLAALGLTSLAGALLVQARGGGVRIPTPARLEELTGRAEAAAVERAEK
jgi:hypothetical protein